MAREVEDVAELLQHIQSRLPPKAAARTSVLSKSWLRAWSTIPTLRLGVGRGGKGMKVVDVDRTLSRYLRDKIPIERFDLDIGIENQEYASHAERWIRTVATKTSLKVITLWIRLGISVTSFALPDEILSGENLTGIRVIASHGYSHTAWIQHPVINCVSLQELHLDGVCITEEALHDILSSCSLLEKIVLEGCCKGFKTVKVKNLPRLHGLQITLDSAYSTALEVSDVPNLDAFGCNQNYRMQPDAPRPFNAHSISVGSSVTRLLLAGVIPDNVCLDMIKSGFPLLEVLALHLTSWTLESFHFTCASIKRLSLLSCPHILTDVQVHAPKLVIFDFDGRALPSLSFPASSLKETTLSLSLRWLPVDADFFLKMRETLTLSHWCYLDITAFMPLDININIQDLRTRLLLPPARNVQQLLFKTIRDECLWEQSPFFDAFFEICHPKRVVADLDASFRHSNHFCRLMLIELFEKKNKTTTPYWPRRLKHVQIRKGPHQKWKTLNISHRSFLDGSAPGVSLEFNLRWR